MTKAKKDQTTAGFSNAALDAMLGDARTPEEVEALFRRMRKGLVERVLAAELTHDLGYEKGDPQPAGQSESSERHDAEDGPDQQWRAAARDSPGSRREFHAAVRAEGGPPAARV